MISFTNLYYSMRDNIKARNVTGIHYDAARITRMLLIFDPIEPVDEDLDRILIPHADSDLYDPKVNTVDDRIIIPNTNSIDSTDTLSNPASNRGNS